MVRIPMRVTVLLLFLSLPFSCASGEENSKPASLADLVSDSAIDLDGDGLVDMILAVVQVDVEQPGYYLLDANLSALNDTSGIDEQTSKSVARELEKRWLCGPQKAVPIPLAFSGADIRKAGLSGDFAMTVYLALKNLSVDSVIVDSVVYPLGQYNHTSFGEYNDQERINRLEKTGAQGSASFKGVCCDGGIDVDGDGFYDFLLISVDVDVHEAGYFFVSGWICSEDGTPICTEKTYTSTGGGIGHSNMCPPGLIRFHLAGSGRKIMLSGVNGPLVLKASLCVQGTGERVDSIECKLSSYESSKFKEWEPVWEMRQ